MFSYKKSLLCGEHNGGEEILYGVGKKSYGRGGDVMIACIIMYTYSVFSLYTYIDVGIFFCSSKKKKKRHKKSLDG